MKDFIRDSDLDDSDEYSDDEIIPFDNPQPTDVGMDASEIVNSESGPSGSNENVNASGTEDGVVTLTEGDWNYSDSSDEEEKFATKEEVFGIAPNINTQRDQPDDIHVGAQVMDIKFHPCTELLVAGTMECELVGYKYLKKEEDDRECSSSEHHSAPIRAVSFNHDGSKVYTVSSDKSIAILDTDTFDIVKTYKKAHDSAINSICVVNENMFATGDDDGILRVWDVRQSKQIFEYRCGEQTINAIIADDIGKTLITSADDGSIAAFNLSNKKLIVESEFFKDALLSMAIIRNGTKLAVGSGSGHIHLFNWGEFGLNTDNVTAQPGPINCMIAVGDNRIITGGEDGNIRAVNLYPHRYIGVVGTHGEYGVESIGATCDQRYLASCANDEYVKFWDLMHVHNLTTDKPIKARTVDMVKNLKSSRKRNRTEFYSDMHKNVTAEEEYIGPVDKPVNIKETPDD